MNLQFSYSFVPASLLFSPVLVQRVPDAVLLGSSCGGNLSSWACAFILLRPIGLRVHVGGGCGKFHASPFSLRARIRTAGQTRSPFPLGESGARVGPDVNARSAAEDRKAVVTMGSARRRDAGLSLAQVPVEFRTRHCLALPGCETHDCTERRRIYPAGSRESRQPSLGTQRDHPPQRHDPAKSDLGVSLDCDPNFCK
jgi:hypothetical protein